MSADLDLEKLFSVRTVEVVEQVQAENLKLALKHVFDELRRAAEAQQAAGIDSLRETVSSLKEAEKAAQAELVAVQAVQVRCRVCAHIPAWGSHHFKTQHNRGTVLSKQALRERCHLSTDIVARGAQSRTRTGQTRQCSMWNASFSSRSSRYPCCWPSDTARTCDECYSGAEPCAHSSFSSAPQSRDDVRRAMQSLQLVPEQLAAARAANAALLERVLHLERRGFPESLPLQSAVGSQGPDQFEALLQPVRQALDALAAEVAALKSSSGLLLNASLLPVAVPGASAPDAAPTISGEKVEAAGSMSSAAEPAGAASGSAHAAAGASANVTAEKPAEAALGSAPAAGAATHASQGLDAEVLPDTEPGAPQTTSAEYSAGPNPTRSRREEDRTAAAPQWSHAASSVGQAALAAAMVPVHKRLAAAEAALHSLATEHPGAVAGELDALAERVMSLHTLVAQQAAHLSSLAADRGAPRRQLSGMGGAGGLLAAAMPVSGEFSGAVSAGGSGGGSVSQSGESQGPGAFSATGPGHDNARARAHVDGSQSGQAGQQACSPLPKICSYTKCLLTAIPAVQCVCNSMCPCTEHTTSRSRWKCYIKLALWKSLVKPHYREMAALLLQHTLLLCTCRTTVSHDSRLALVCFLQHVMEANVMEHASAVTAAATADRWNARHAELADLRASVSELAQAGGPLAMRVQLLEDALAGQASMPSAAILRRTTSSTGPVMERILAVSGALEGATHTNIYTSASALVCCSRTGPVLKHITALSGALNGANHPDMPLPSLLECCLSGNY